MLSNRARSLLGPRVRSHYLVTHLMRCLGWRAGELNQSVLPNPCCQSMLPIHNCKSMLPWFCQDAKLRSGSYAKSVVMPKDGYFNVEGEAAVLEHSSSQLSLAAVATCSVLGQSGEVPGLTGLTGITKYKKCRA